MAKIILSVPDQPVSFEELTKTLTLCHSLSQATSAFTQCVFEALENYLLNLTDTIEEGEAILLKDAEEVAAIMRTLYPSATNNVAMMRYKKAIIKRAKTIGIYTICKGSVIPKPRNSISVTAKKLYDHAISNNLIDSETDVLNAELEASSASVAASLCSGYQVNGLKELNAILWHEK